MITYLICLAVQILLSLEVLRRKDLDLVGKLVMIFVIIAVPYLLGAIFYYVYGRQHAAEWFNKK